MAVYCHFFGRFAISTTAAPMSAHGEKHHTLDQAATEMSSILGKLCSVGQTFLFALLADISAANRNGVPTQKGDSAEQAGVDGPAASDYHSQPET